MKLCLLCPPRHCAQIICGLCCACAFALGDRWMDGSFGSTATKLAAHGCGVARVERRLGPHQPETGCLPNAALFRLKWWEMQRHCLRYNAICCFCDGGDCDDGESQGPACKTGHPPKPWWMSEFQQGLGFLRLVAISPLPEVGFQLPTLLSQV